MKKIFSLIISFIIIFGPVAVMAYTTGEGIVPRCGQVVDGVIENPCNFTSLMELVNNVINFLLFTIATPLAALVFVYAGIMLITAGGDSGKLTTAKTILKNLLIGYLIALAAWLIINTIMSGLGFTGGFLTGIKN